MMPLVTPNMGPKGIWGINFLGWTRLHTISSLVMVGGVLLHLILHWRWILNMLKREWKHAFRKD